MPKRGMKWPDAKERKEWKWKGIATVANIIIILLSSRGVDDEWERG